MLEILKKDNVKSVMILVTAVAIAVSLTILISIAADSFKISDNWIFSFLKKYKLVWQRYTRVSQKLPVQTEEVLKRFHQFVICLKIKKSFKLHNILNIDETPICFNIAKNFIIEQKGKKTIHIYAISNEKN